MKTYKVYLAGPITGLTFGESTDWREYAKEQLSYVAGSSCMRDNNGDGDCPMCDPNAPHNRGLPQGYNKYPCHGYQPTGIQGYSPMRAKDYLKNVGVISGRPEAYEDRILSSAKGITYRDGWDVDTADVLLINFLGAEKLSAGTIWEIGRASYQRKPIVAAMDEANVHNHPITNTSIGWITPDLDMAIDIVKAICLPDGVTVTEPVFA